MANVKLNTYHLLSSFLLKKATDDLLSTKYGRYDSTDLTLIAGIVAGFKPINYDLSTPFRYKTYVAYLVIMFMRYFKVKDEDQLQELVQTLYNPNAEQIMPHAMLVEFRRCLCKRINSLLVSNKLKKLEDEFTQLILDNNDLVNIDDNTYLSDMSCYTNDNLYKDLVAILKTHVNPQHSIIYEISKCIDLVKESDGEVQLLKRLQELNATPVKRKRAPYKTKKTRASSPNMSAVQSKPEDSWDVTDTDIEEIFEDANVSAIESSTELSGDETIDHHVTKSSQIISTSTIPSSVTAEPLDGDNYPCLDDTLNNSSSNSSTTSLSSDEDVLNRIAADALDAIETTESLLVTSTENEETSVAPTNDTDLEAVKKMPKRHLNSSISKRQKWNEIETMSLVIGVIKFGRGNWKRILATFKDKFGDRTSIQLKDKYRNLEKFDEIKAYEHKARAHFAAKERKKQQKQASDASASS